MSVNNVAEARKMVEAIPMGEKAAGYVEYLGQIQEAFLGPEANRTAVVTIEVLDALEGEGLIHCAFATPSSGSLPEGTLSVYRRGPKPEPPPSEEDGDAPPPEAYTVD